MAKGLGLLCLGFEGVQKEIPSEEASTLHIGSVTFPPGQYTSPQLYPCHRLFDQDGHQDSCSPSLSSRPFSLWLLVIPLAQKLSLWDNWWDERGCDKGHWHAHTRGLPWGLAELVGTVQQPEEITSKRTRVSCVYYQWKCPYEKKSGNLSYAPRISLFLPVFHTSDSW